MFADFFAAISLKAAGKVVKLDQTADRRNPGDAGMGEKAGSKCRKDGKKANLKKVLDKTIL